jgi:hypothetical protein
VDDARSPLQLSQVAGEYRHWADGGSATTAATIDQ